MRGWTLALFLVLLAGCRKPAPGEADVKGRAEDANGKPLARMVLRFIAQDEANKHSTLTCPTDAEGKFVGRCLPGRYKVTLSALPTGVGGGPVGGKGPAPAGPKLPDNVPPNYSSPRDTPWEIEVPSGGKTDILLQIVNP